MLSRLIILSFFLGYINTTLSHKSILLPDSIYSIRERLNLKNGKRNICNSLQQSLIKEIDILSDKLSISIIDQNRNLIVDINGNIPRMPASNQKLISTAYALDKLGPYYRIRTTLARTSDTEFHIYGNGDPDFKKLDLNKFIKKIENNIIDLDEKNITVYLYEEDNSNWYPKGWTINDKSETYGAPITRLALNSNSASLKQPTKLIAIYLERELMKRGIKAEIKIIGQSKLPPFIFLNVISQVKSAKLYSLLNLANSESHNFTAEVLFRNSINRWEKRYISPQLVTWLRYNGINTRNFIQADASGLSRLNRVTTNGLVLLLNKIYHTKYSEFYFSSLSLYGIRGTLSDMQYDRNLYGKFFGKTGTLNNVRTLSGLFISDSEPFFLSIMANDIENTNDITTRLLTVISKNKLCI